MSLVLQTTRNSSTRTYKQLRQFYAPRISTVPKGTPHIRFISCSTSGRGNKITTESPTSSERELLTPIELGDDASPNPWNLKEVWGQLPSRYQLLISTFLAFVTCNMDKVNMSVAIIPMSHEFGWNSTVAGLVQSSFFYGYMLCQLPGGYLSTRFSGSRMLPIGVGLWSAATFGLPVVGGSIPGLCFSRLMVGVGEALAPAAVTDAIVRMMPVQERSRSVTFVNSGLYSGTILGLLTSPLLIENFGWEAVFYVFGGVGLLWVLWWELLVKQTSTKDPETFSNIRKHTKASKSNENIPWRAMFRSQPVQALIYTHFCSAWYHSTLFSWLPSYFSSTMGLSLGDAARISLLPPIAGIVVTTFAGSAADALITRGVKTGIVRKLCQCTAFIGPTFCLLGASFAESNELKTALITSAIGLAGFCCAGLYCNSQDLSPKYAGFLLSLTTMFSAVPGIIGVPTNGALYDATGSWPLALFAPAMFFMVTGAIVFALFGRGEEIELTNNEPFPFEKHLDFKWIQSMLAKEV